RRSRTKSGPSSTIDTATSTDAGSYSGGIIVYDCDLYFTYVNLNGDVLLRKYDGSSVTTDRDVGATDGARQVGQPYVYGGALYVPFLSTASSAADGFLLRKASGWWTQVAANLNVRGFFGRREVAPWRRSISRNPARALPWW